MEDEISDNSMMPSQRPTKAQRELKRLKFNPIAKLVDKYAELEEEIALQKAFRSGSIVQVSPVTGKPINGYRADYLLGVFDKQLTIAKELLRYNFARVSEAVEAEKVVPPPLTVHLTAPGQKFVLNGDGFAEDAEEVPVRQIAG